MEYYIKNEPLSRPNRSYSKYLHTSNYIKSKSLQAHTTLEMVSCSGFGNLQKFKDHRQLFDTCRKDIPLSYLDSIGVDLKIVQFCIELDTEIYYNQLDSIPKPRHFFVKLTGGCCKPMALPTLVSESETLKYIHRSMLDKSLSTCSVVYENLKTIQVWHNGNVDIRFYSPTIKIGREKIQFLKHVSTVLNLYDERFNNSNI